LDLDKSTAPQFTLRGFLLSRLIACHAIRLALRGAGGALLVWVGALLGEGWRALRLHVLPPTAKLWNIIGYYKAVNNFGVSYYPLQCNGLEGFSYCINIYIIIL
jgi:hypothetical protein